MECPGPRDTGSVKIFRFRMPATRHLFVLKILRTRCEIFAFPKLILMWLEYCRKNHLQSLAFDKGPLEMMSHRRGKPLTLLYERATFFEVGPKMKGLSSVLALQSRLILTVC